MPRAVRWFLLVAALGLNFVVPSVLRAADKDDGVRRIPQTASFPYSIEIMRNGQSQDVTAAFNMWVDAHTARGVVFHTRTQPVTKSPLGDSRAVLGIGGKAQLIEIDDLSEQAMPATHRYGDTGEPLYFVIRGTGTTKYTKDGKESEVKWKANDLFAIPPGSWIEHTLAPGLSARLLEYVGYGVNTYTREEMEEERTSPSEGTPEERQRLKWAGTYFPNMREAEVLDRDVDNFFKRRVIDVSPAGHKTHPTVQINEIPPGGSTQPPGFIHRHGGQSTYYVLKGTGWDEIYKKDQKPQKYPIAEGDIIGYPPGSYHHYHFNGSKTEFFRLMPMVPRYEQKK